MFAIFRSHLGRRILLLGGMSTLFVLAALAISGWLAIEEGSQQIYQERQALAQTTASYLDYILRQNLERLESVRFAPGVDIEDSDMEAEKKALHSTYLGSIFDGGVFMTNQEGTVLWVEPFRSAFSGANISHYPVVQESLKTGKPLVSDALSSEPDGKKVIFILSALRNPEGIIVGLVGGQISAPLRVLQEFTQFAELGETSYSDVIDSNGVILASTNPAHPLKVESEITGQEPAGLTVLAPLSTAGWSVVISQSEREALAPVRKMEQRFIIFGLASLVMALFFSWGMARSLIKPVVQLTIAARNISQGDLSRPITPLGNDEVSELSRSLENMRIALKTSLEEIQEWNRALEAKVDERTSQLQDTSREIKQSEATRRELLHKLLGAQEDERRRVARELHDETSQRLAGLVMRLDAVLSTPDETNGKIKNMLADIKNLAVSTIDNVHKLIFDLRPLVLDDLGLLSALRWYAENRLGEYGIKTRVEVTGEEQKLPSQTETAIFRVVQEAITNVVKHAEAQNLVLSVEFGDSTLRIEVEDDGKGFDVEAVTLQADSNRGLGLLGMKERVSLLGGQLGIESAPGGGTHLTIEVPLHPGVAV
ncbi:MAG: hypothetical protein HW402_1565 [Dehalococcoidales bacterium]|nr:hypothetical protein [Dehalococcoidales bacterium]